MALACALGLSLLAATGCGDSDAPGSGDSGGGAADAASGRDAGGGGGSGDSAVVGADAAAGSLTYHEHAQPILARNCLACHTKGGIGPFQLDSYASVKARAAIIAAVVKDRRMPPWMPAGDDGKTCEKLKHARRLSTAEIDVIGRWVAAGAPEGDPAKAPGGRPPTLAKLPRVDAELDAGFDFKPPASGRVDDYRCFMLDPKLAATRFVTGVDVAPGVRSMVHHVILFKTSRAAAQSKASANPNGWSCFGGASVGGGTSMLGGWAPGTPATAYPKGTGIPLTASQVVVMQVHYNYDQTRSPDRTKLRLMYADSAVKPATMNLLVHSSFALPPGQSVTSERSFTRGGRLWAVFPHMHTLGTRITIELQPFGASSKACMVDIPRWDFDWQQLYLFDRANGVALAAGSRIVMRCTWNNTTSKLVTFGEGTNDEMCVAAVYLTAD